MSTVSTTPVQSPALEIQALTREVAEASDPHIKRIVAKVDAMAIRGPADALIEPLRQRLRILRPPRPLRFGRLLSIRLIPSSCPPPAGSSGKARSHVRP